MTDERGTPLILVVDDVKALANLLAKMLEERGYQIVMGNSGTEALEQADRHLPDLILMDINMPEMDGYEVCKRLKAVPETRDIPIIFISAMGETTDKVKAFSHGGVDYITKPFEVGEVLARVKNHLDLKRLQQQLQRANTQLEGRVAERTAALQDNVEKLERTLDSVVYAMAKVVEIRDPYTAGHQQRVAQLTRAIAEELALPEDTVVSSHKTAVIHDVGKIYVPAEILSKPGRLTNLEFGIIKAHTEIGADLVRTIDFPWPISNIILQHHERLDGSGYPRGIAGDEILLEARLIGVADTVEAMSSHRPYRAALGIDRALEEVESHAGSVYDADAVAACVRLFREKSFRFDGVT